MAINANVRHYYLEAYTPSGPISLMSDLAAECVCTYLLQGSPGLDTSTFIKLIGIQLSDRRHDVDYIRQARDPDALAGLYLPGTGIGLLDLNGISVEDGLADEPGHMTVHIDLAECLHKGKWGLRRHEVEERLGKQKELALERDRLLAREYPVSPETSESQSIQKLLEQVAQSELPHFFQDLRCGEESCEKEMKSIVDVIQQNNVSFCFLHALQRDGWANYAPRYLRNLDRIWVDDDDGSSSVLHDILNEIKSLGQKIVIVLHPIFPYSVIGIVFPWKNLAVWKGNPAKPEDLGLKEKHGPELAHVLEEMQHLRQSMRSIAYECVSAQRLDVVRNDLVSDILGQIQMC